MAKMFEVAVMTSAPADGLTLVDVKRFDTIEQVTEFMNIRARIWADDLKPQGFEVDDDSMPHNYEDPMQLDEDHTWLTAGLREYEFNAAYRVIET